jgi:hypothetical protein
VEYQGRQHYIPQRFFGGVEMLRLVQHRDAIKRRWARRNGFKLIVIPYTVKNIEQYISKRIPVVEVQQVAQRAA